MIIENLPILKINKLTKAQYEAALAAGTVNENELYMTEEENVDLTTYNEHINNSDIHITAAERTKWNNKSDFSGSYNDLSNKPTIPTVPTKVSAFTNDAGYLTEHQDISGKVNKSGDTMTGKLSVPQVETGEAASSYFQARKFRGEGNADTYYHAIDFGYANHDQVDFHEYGGRWNFYKNQKGAYNTGVLIGSITTNGWEGSAKLTGSPTAPTASKGANNTQIATTAFVQSEISGIALKPTITTTTLLASGWNDGAYSFETGYPSATYDIEIALDSTASSEQVEAFNGAQIVGSATSNIIKAYGNVPTVDIPIILKVIKK